MNNRNAALMASAVAVAVLIALVVAVYLAGSAGGGDFPSVDNGSLLHPQVMREARDAYVLTELYQDVAMDVRSGVYDLDGALGDRYWSHDAITQTCSVDLVFADQHGRDEIAPTATPRPPDPTATPALVALPQIWAGATPARVADDRMVTVVPPAPANTPTPYPTATPVVTAATNWNHWKGRPLAIEADGLAVLDVPRDARVSAYLSVRTGADSGHNSHTELARLPLPEPRWENGFAYVALAHASGRILLASDAIDATYRAAVLHLDISPLSGCSGLRLRWQRSAAVVIRALTDQPFSDWGGRAAPPPTQPPAGIALYAAIGDDATFTVADLLAGTSSTVAGHIVIPDDTADSHISFAVRADLIPSGLTDIRQAGSAFNSRIAFDPATGDPDILLDMDGDGTDDFKLYVSQQPWQASLLGGEWSLR